MTITELAMSFAATRWFVGSLIIGGTSVAQLDQVFKVLPDQVAARLIAGWTPSATDTIPPHKKGPQLRAFSVAVVRIRQQYDDAITSSSRLSPEPQQRPARLLLGTTSAATTARPRRQLLRQRHGGDHKHGILVAAVEHQAHAVRQLDVRSVDRFADFRVFQVYLDEARRIASAGRRLRLRSTWLTMAAEDLTAGETSD